MQIFLNLITLMIAIHSGSHLTIHGIIKSEELFDVKYNTTRKMIGTKWADGEC